MYAFMYAMKSNNDNIYEHPSFTQALHMEADVDFVPSQTLSKTLWSQFTHKSVLLMFHKMNLKRKNMA